MKRYIKVALISITLLVSTATYPDHTTYMELIIPFPEQVNRDLGNLIDSINRAYPEILDSRTVQTSADAPLASRPHINLLTIGRITQKDAKLYEKELSHIIVNTDAFELVLGGNELATPFVLTGGDEDELALTYPASKELQKLANKMRLVLSKKKLPYSSLLFAGSIRLGKLLDRRYGELINKEMAVPKTAISVDQVYLVKDNRVIKSYRLRK